MNAQEIRADMAQALKKLYESMPKPDNDNDAFMAAIAQLAFQLVSGLFVESAEIAAQLAEAQLPLRDRMALACMQGDWAAQDCDCNGQFSNDVSDHLLRGRAIIYYRMADAMLYVRDHPKQEAPPTP